MRFGAIEAAALGLAGGGVAAGAQHYGPGAKALIAGERSKAEAETK